MMAHRRRAEFASAKKRANLSVQAPETRSSQMLAGRTRSFIPVEALAGADEWHTRFYDAASGGQKRSPGSGLRRTKWR